jgi:exosortase K
MASTETGLRPRHWGLILLAIVVFKQGYGLAEAGQLQWMLMPLVEILECVGGLSFELQPDGTWLDAEHRVLLVKACAGGNFLLTAWLACLWRWRHRTSPLRTILSAAGAAWVTALAANTVRILLALHGQDTLARLTGLTPSDSHRLIGIGVYLVCLWALLSGPGRVHAALSAATGLYLGFNLALPALRAWLLGLPAIDRGHLVWTAGIPLAALGLSLLLRRVGRLRRLNARLCSRCSRAVKLSIGPLYDVATNTPCASHFPNSRPSCTCDIANDRDKICPPKRRGFEP